MSLALFISDCHLSQNTPKTNKAFINFCKKEAIKADQIFILGDLFDYWYGDDMISQLWVKEICLALYQLKKKKIQTFFIPGNRDFLIGNTFFKESGLTPLNEIVKLNIQEKNIVLLHGDTLCSNDRLYFYFRKIIRSKLINKIFCSLPINFKKKITKTIRKLSKNRGKKFAKNNYLEKVNANIKTVIKLMNQLNAKIMIHGHTHQPGYHQEGQLERFVLSDWDLDGIKKRGNYLQLKNGKINSIDIEVL